MSESYLVADCQFLDGSVSVELHPNDEVLGTYENLKLALAQHWMLRCEEVCVIWRARQRRGVA